MNLGGTYTPRVTCKPLTSCLPHSARLSGLSAGLPKCWVRKPSWLFTPPQRTCFIFGRSHQQRFPPAPLRPHAGVKRHIKGGLPASTLPTSQLVCVQLHEVKTDRYLGIQSHGNSKLLAYSCGGTQRCLVADTGFAPVTPGNEPGGLLLPQSAPYSVASLPEYHADGPFNATAPPIFAATVFCFTQGAGFPSAHTGALIIRLMSPSACGCIQWQEHVNSKLLAYSHSGTQL